MAPFCGIHGIHQRAPWGAGFASSLLMNSARKEYGKKRGVFARDARTLRTNQLKASDLKKVSRSGIVRGNTVNGWKLAVNGPIQATDAFCTAFSRLFASVLFGSRDVVLPKNLFLLKTIKKIGDEEVPFITVTDRDPASLEPSEIEGDEWQEIEERSEDFRREALNGPEMLSVAEAAALTGFSRQHINNLCRDGRLIGLIQPGRERGLRLPKWQFAEGIVGEPLKAVLEILKAVDTWDKWLFFTSKDEALAGFSPVELMTGNAKVIPHTKSAANLLQDSKAVRLQKVLDAAKGYASN